MANSGDHLEVSVDAECFLGPLACGSEAPCPLSKIWLRCPLDHLALLPQLPCFAPPHTFQRQHLLQDLAPLHGEIDSLHLALGKLLDEPVPTGLEGGLWRPKGVACRNR